MFTIRRSTKLFSRIRRALTSFHVPSNDPYYGKYNFNHQGFKIFKPTRPVFQISTYPTEMDVERNKRINTMRDNAVVSTSTADKKSFFEYFSTRLGYTSTAIEGNTFTEAQAMLFLRRGVTIGGKSLKEHQELRCHERGLQFVYDIATQDASRQWDVALVQDLHKLVLPYPDKSDDPIPGQFKLVSNRTNTILPGTKQLVVLQFAAPEDARDELFELLRWVNANEKTMDIVQLITVMHYNFVRIHIFPDCNGRTCRLLTSLLLMRRGYPPMVIENTDKEEYYNALAEGDFNNDLRPLLEFFSKCLLATYADLDHSFKL